MSTIGWSGSGRAAERISTWLMKQLLGRRTAADEGKPAILPERAPEAGPAAACGTPCAGRRRAPVAAPVLSRHGDALPYASARPHVRHHALPAPVRTARPGFHHLAQPGADGLDAHRPRGPPARLSQTRGLFRRTRRRRRRADGHRRLLAEPGRLAESFRGQAQLAAERAQAPPGAIGRAPD